MKAHTYKRGTERIKVPVSEKMMSVMLYTLHEKHGVGAIRAKRFFEAFEYNFIKISGEVARHIDEFTSETLNLLKSKNIHIAHIQEKELQTVTKKRYKFELTKETIADIAMLRTLVEVLKFGRKRCIQFYTDINAIADDMRKRFRSGNDDGHYEVMIQRLKGYNIDVPQWIKEMGV